MLKNVHPKHKTQALRYRTYLPRAVLYVAIAIAALTIGLWYYEAYWEPSHPPSTTDYYQSLNLSEAKQATYNNSSIVKIRALETSNGIKHELVSFNVPKDGLSEFALMSLPSKPATGGKYPIIILCHGYSAPSRYSTLNDYLPDMNFYSSHGYAVIKPDYRGNGFSIPNGVATSAYYSMDYNTDIMSLIAAIKKTDYLNSKDINLWGHSMGGYIALRAAVLSRDIKTVILLSAPVGTSQDMYADYSAISDIDNPTASDIRDQELIAHGTPLSNPDYWNKTSPLSYLAGFKPHIEVNVGLDDSIVPPEFSADLNNALNKANVEHQYFTYAGGGHGLVAQRSQIWARSLKLLNEN